MQRDRVIEVGLSACFWCDQDKNGFASILVDGHWENYLIRSNVFSNWLRLEFGNLYPVKVRSGQTRPTHISKQVITDALDAFEAMAIKNPGFETAIRLGQHGGNLYFDLGSPNWEAVEITPYGWQIVPSSPIPFVRPKGLRQLPMPIKGGSLNDLRPFLNLRSHEDFILTVGWLITTFHPTGPYPILVVNGEQGSAKSTFCRLLQRLVDPKKAGLRTPPSDERNLLIAAKNCRILALDNLSFIDRDMSDSLCRLSTGSGFSTRELYTNQEEDTIEVCRPIIVNGIPSFTTRPDLLDRSFVIVLPPLAETERKSETDLIAAFDSAASRILGALFDAVSGAMRNHASIVLTEAPRMVDCVKWVEASAQVLGWHQNSFLNAYKANSYGAIQNAMEGDPLMSAIKQFVENLNGQEWKGTASDLLGELKNLIAFEQQKNANWPKDATRLGSRLRQVAPALRSAGILIKTDERSSERARTRLIYLQKTKCNVRADLASE